MHPPRGVAARHPRSGPDGVPKLLPRRDVATVDAIVLREAPAPDDAATLYLIKRLQDAGVHFLMDDHVLRTAPEPLKSGGVPLVKCDALTTYEPAPSNRLAVVCDGNESDDSLDYEHEDVLCLLAAADESG